jgi:hypothetical protein
MKLRVLAVLAVVLSLAACTAQQTIAQSLAASQAAVDIYLSLYAPAWSGITSVNTLYGQAIADAQNFQPGPATSEAQQVLADLANALDAAPLLNTQTNDAIAAAVDWIDNELTILKAVNAAPPEQQQAAFSAWLEMEQMSAPQSSAHAGTATNGAHRAPERRHVWKGAPITSYPQFVKAWNQNAPQAAQIHGPNLVNKAGSSCKTAAAATGKAVGHAAVKTGRAVKHGLSWLGS